MNCPICNSNQTTCLAEAGFCAQYLECANCDFEGTVEDTPGDCEDMLLEHSAFLSKERGRRRGRR